MHPKPHEILNPKNDSLLSVMICLAPSQVDVLHAMLEHNMLDMLVGQRESYIIAMANIRRIAMDHNGEAPKTPEKEAILEYMFP